MRGEKATVDWITGLYVGQQLTCAEIVEIVRLDGRCLSVASLQRFMVANGIERRRRGPRGATHIHLTADMVREARRRRGKDGSGESLRAIAKDLHVSVSCISDAVRYKTWKDIE